VGFVRLGTLVVDVLSLLRYSIAINILGRYQSGQLGQTVNLLAYAFESSNLSRPTKGISLRERFFCWVDFGGGVAMILVSSLYGGRYENC
jgi:hypothetical protein